MCLQSQPEIELEAQLSFLAHFPPGWWIFGQQTLLSRRLSIKAALFHGMTALPRGRKNATPLITDTGVGKIYHLDPTTSTFTTVLAHSSWGKYDSQSRRNTGRHQWHPIKPGVQDSLLDQHHQSHLL